MTRGLRGVLFLATLVAALAVPQLAAAGPPYTSKRESYFVDTPHGKIYVLVDRPLDNGQTVKGPAILTYSPYSILGRNGDQGQYVPRGYVRAWADVVGTGNSGGCWDYGGIREQETGYAVVEWLAAQPWSTGKVGMVGGSYNGTTATATAITKPPHLTTIVPEAGISRWYEYAFSGGVRYFVNNENPSDEGVDTPLAFDFGLAIPPPVDVTEPTWGERVASTVTPCDELVHTQHGYDATPDYDAFWLERDYITRANRITIPVLIAHNWGDWNVKQEEAINLYRALTNSPNKKLWMGTRYSGHGTPGGGYGQAKNAWFDHYLLGLDNGAQNIDAVHSQMSTYDGPGAWYAGPWPVSTPVSLIAQQDTNDPDYAWKLLPKSRKGAGVLPARFTSTGKNAESNANANPRANAEWFWFESPPLARDLRIFGEVKVVLWSTIGRTWVTYTPTILDIDPAHRIIAPGQLVATDDRGLISTTRGWLDTRYRDSLKVQKLVQPGATFKTTIVEKPQDYTFEAGHIIGLQVQTENTEWSLVKPYPGCDTPQCTTIQVDYANGQTRVILPVVGVVSNPAVLFAAG